MKVYFDVPKNFIVIEGLKQIFQPWSLRAAIENGKVSIYQADSSDRVLGPIAFNRIRTISGDRFPDIGAAIAYLISVFSQERPRKQFIWETGSATNHWHIVHNMGYYPRVIVKDSAGTEFFPDVTNIDENTIEITFTYPMSGMAIIL